MESDLKEVRTKMFKLQTNTQESLSLINKKIDDIIDDLRAFTVSADRLKSEIQTIHIQNAKQSSDLKKNNETYGKVILLEDKVDKLQTITRSVLGEMRNKKTQG